MKKRIECHIEGRVQMVMYRDFAVRKATALGVVGTVQNMPDGSVLLNAEGEESFINLYIEKLKRGSVLSHVEHVEVLWSEPHGQWSDFRIVYK